MEEITQITQSGGNTNPRFRKVCFTLNNYTDDEFTQLLRDFDNMKYIIGKEIGESGTPHLQGYVEFGRQLSLKQLKKINNRIHWEKARGSKKDNVKYCSKDGDFISTFPVERRERLLNKYKDIVWKDWQQEVIDIIENEGDTRTINWFWEQEGNQGKSFLCKYLYLKYNAIICTGKAQDIFNQVKVFFDDKENEEVDDIIVICDIPRSMSDYVSYQALEKLSDGLIYSGKYEGGVVSWNSSKIICFSNSTPNYCEMSRDRWNVRSIEDDYIH